MSEQKSCKQRVRSELRSEIATIRKLWELYKTDPEANDDELGNFNEHGLCFDYVAPGTFDGQRRGYWRWQISWGGPSDEFRFFCDENYQPTSIQYWFMDWFDGAHIPLEGADRELLEEIWDDWRDMEVPQCAQAKAAD
jgi:hypothetical protein